MEKDQTKFDPTDLDQWIFYVLSTKKLDEQVGNQKTISLGKVIKLNPVECRFGGIQEAIITALEST